MAGVVTAAGAFVEVGGVMHRLPATKTPVGAWVAGIIAAIDADVAAGVEPCPYCDGYCGCGCDEWIEAMEAQPGPAPHGDLSWAKNEKLPF